MVLGPKSAVARVQRPEIAGAVHELSFDRVYEEYFPFVWRSLLRLGLSQANVDDAAQDVFLVVHRRLQEFEGRSSLKTWIFCVAQRVALVYRRRERRSESQAPVPATLLDRRSCPEQQTEAARAAAFLDAFLTRLDDGKRAVFILIELEQLTAPEAAEALGIKLNTVYSRLRSARAAFREAARADRRLP
jgi:RNA polymerase sigma-70 factor (ECF subfamily)